MENHSQLVHQALTDWRVWMLTDRFLIKTLKVILNVYLQLTAIFTNAEQQIICGCSKKTFTTCSKHQQIMQDFAKINIMPSLKIRYFCERNWYKGGTSYTFLQKTLRSFQHQNSPNFHKQFNFFYQTMSDWTEPPFHNQSSSFISTLFWINQIILVFVI